ncbi:MAG: DUF2179 domain-containing protein [Myxococcales bacterium]|nr:DUF2179 domain-containing protein [Myxococcales bacterium]
MNSEIWLTCVFIVLARITDVSLGTLRTVAVITGRRYLAFLLGFCEILVWVFAVSKVVQNLDRPAFAVSYAFGFALGNFLGITIENRVALGNQVLRVFTRMGKEVAETLRAHGFPVTSFLGEGRDGPVSLLFIETRRKDAVTVTRVARDIDPACFYVIDDIRMASTAMQLHQPTGWRAIIKKI